ncbi:MAG: hypothetical protein U5L08_04475 [Xanthomonadales bacterium]|nr:hypothetical protein [Xanthomonadales bacterium]
MGDDMTDTIKTDNSGVVARLEKRVAELERELSSTRHSLDQVVDLAIFMCATWEQIDSWAYEQCDGDALMKYPVVQGTRNQLDLGRVGALPMNKQNLRQGLSFILLNREAEKPSTGNGR